jgi:hypothetical protein
MKKYQDWMKLILCLSRTLSKHNISQYETLLSQLEIFSRECSVFPQNTQCYSKAIANRWYGAAAKVQDHIRMNLNDFTFKVQQFKDKFCIEKFQPPSISMLFSEFQQAEQEFGHLNYDLENKTLSIITEPIVLDDLNLGSFEIRLDIERIDKVNQTMPYRIIALEPYPAGSDENVTHPHVSNEFLCEGDGHIPIRKALTEGRLCDFFMMVTAILNTYNPGSPYVSLDDWDGVCCYDCGYRVCSDESYYCENCNNDFCGNCSGYCKICDATLCNGCLSECPDCHEPVCKDCYGICRDCEREVCQDCLEEGLCYVCIENRKDNEDEEETIQIPKNPIPSVQSDSMGQARISA